MTSSIPILVKKKINKGREKITKSVMLAKQQTANTCDGTFRYKEIIKGFRFGKMRHFLVEIGKIALKFSEVETIISLSGNGSDYLKISQCIRRKSYLIQT